MLAARVCSVCIRSRSWTTTDITSSQTTDSSKISSLRKAQIIMGWIPVCSGGHSGDTLKEALVVLLQLKRSLDY